MVALLASFFFVVLAEMGDKTQLLAMAFATRYKASEVLWAVFIATLLNHTLAVLAGRFLALVVPLDVISFVAALSFVFFGLWTIRGDSLEGEEKRESSWGPVATVAIAFFLAEMGDKTQLATISLAIKYQSIVYVLMGTTLGMVVADAVGIIVGIVMRKHIPEKMIKGVAACLFMLFGLLGIYKVLSGRAGQAQAWIIVSLIALAALAVGISLWRSDKKLKVRG